MSPEEEGHTILDRFRLAPQGETHPRGVATNSATHRTLLHTRDNRCTGYNVEPRLHEGKAGAILIASTSSDGPRSFDTDSTSIIPCITMHTSAYIRGGCCTPLGCDTDALVHHKLRRTGTRDAPQ